MTQTQRKTWSGSAPTACAICGRNLERAGIFIDGATVMGPWAQLCPSCHISYGRGLGTGKGQQYELKGKIWEKTKG